MRWVSPCSRVWSFAVSVFVFARCERDLPELVRSSRLLRCFRSASCCGNESTKPAGPAEARGVWGQACTRRRQPHAFVRPSVDARTVVTTPLNGGHVEDAVAVGLRRRHSSQALRRSARRRLGYRHARELDDTVTTQNYSAMSISPRRRRSGLHGLGRCHHSSSTVRWQHHSQHHTRSFTAHIGRAGTRTAPTAPRTTSSSSPGPCSMARH